MRPPDRPREHDSDDVARAVLAGMAGAICGAMTMLAVVHLPILVFRLRGDEAAGLVLALGFWGIPAGFIAGAFAGVHARRRFGGIAVVIAMAASVIGAPMIVAVAESVAVGSPATSANGCKNLDRHYTVASNADVVIFRRACPGRASTIEATVELRGQHYDESAPGNALVLAAQRGTLDGLDVRVLGGPDSILAFAYDPRLSVVRLTQRIGDIAIRAVPETRAQPVSASPDSATSPVASEDRPVLDRRPTECSIEPRMVDGSPGRAVSIFKRACPGKPPTIEAFIATRDGSTYSAERGNALVVDASADSPAHPISIFVTRPSREAIVFEVDRRARIIYLGSRVNGVSVDAIGGTP